MTRAEPLGVHMSDMLEFLDTGFLTAPKVDVDPLQRQINMPSKRAKGQIHLHGGFTSNMAALETRKISPAHTDG